MAFAFDYEGWKTERDPKSPPFWPKGVIGESPVRRPAGKKIIFPTKKSKKTAQKLYQKKQGIFWIGVSEFGQKGI